MRRAPTFTEVMDLWWAIEADFQREYGIDLSAAPRRSWRWFVNRLVGLSPDSLWAQINRQEGRDGRRMVTDPVEGDAILFG